MNYIKIWGMFVLAFLMIIVAQALGAIFDEMIPFLGIGIIISALIYCIVIYFFVRLMIEKGLKQRRVDYRIVSPHFDIRAVILGIILPLSVILFYLIFVPGEFKISHFKTQDTLFHSLFWDIFQVAVAGAIVEELVFRGLLMGYIEKKTNIVVAILTTSIFFGAIHVLNGALNVGSFLQLLVGGSLAGVMFGLTAYVFRSIWASATLHFFWNISQVFYITEKQVDDKVFQYILDSHNFALTGGEFGFEASIISILGYVSVIVVLVMLRRRLRQ